MKFQIVAGEVSVDLVNTLDNRPDPERHKELLNSYQDVVDWALQAGVISSTQRSRLLKAVQSRPDEATDVLRQAIELRECLNRIYGSVVAGRRPAEIDLQGLNSWLAKAMSNLRLKAAGGGFRLEWNDDGSPPLEWVLWPVARSAVEFLVSSDLANLRECGEPECRWMFVDRSKNHSRRWCDMRVCGNRVKVRKFYRRHATEGEGAM